MPLKIYLLLLFYLITFLPIKGQGLTDTAKQRKFNQSYLDSLWSIEKGNRVSKHFAGLYRQTVLITNAFASAQNPAAQDFTIRLDDAFIPIFFQAHDAYLKGKEIPANWKAYYQSDSLNSLQYQFLGMNAHINGDLHLALIQQFGYDTIKAHKKALMSFQKVLNTIVDSVYEQTKAYPELKIFHDLTLGTNRIMAREMVRHWRRRQINLALLYYHKPKKYKRRYKHVQSLKAKWDQAVLEHFRAATT
ncbi:MAG: hypothetical protein B7Y15_06975 [Bacteroidetes bacterium 24-39-8]|jgi:hypothetical protein|nr:MAG: hypothetical protein B7Y69_03850 [Sphingobacteriia bacterium 35-40-8]OYZ51137.1 MAG: hypothetical protein B7Y15_06975 [Bacteroidetes bacterium 24-39-8]OZA69212.1 MAG: hypothetical protein B7X72_00610 [Sphingobacteriia bacterium 39-39-8]HQR92286.1 DUF5995 family protein [Sediminibacterium sp.]HQS55240.1 DUF5995 family protein [Sediminibacterium sp.]